MIAQNLDQHERDHLRPARHLGAVVERDNNGNIILAQPLGLAHGYVRLVPHQSSWAQSFQLEANLITQALGSELVVIEHIGSTSIPNIKAKPIIDVLAGVKSIEDEAMIINRLEQIGYSFAGNDIVPDNLMFSLGTVRTHLLHVTQYRNSSWNECLRFRDILRKRREIAQEYERFKTDLATRFKSDRYGYTEAKSEFVRKKLNKQSS